MEEAELTYPAWWEVLVNPYAIGLILSAVLVSVYAAFRSLAMEQILRTQLADSQEEMTLTAKHGLIFPIVGSIFLIVFFYFFDIVVIIFVIISCTSAFAGLVWTFLPLVPQNNSSHWGNTALYVMAGLTIFVWIVTQNVLLNNLLGMALCVLWISVARVANVKTCAIIFFALFIYDIFWVFYSKSIFGENVMVAVATKQATNPAKHIAESLNLMDVVAPVLNLPLKLVFGKIMLGLGDIFLPGILIAYSLRFCHAQGVYSHFIYTVCGYTIGLILSAVMATTFRAAQPALLYIVPTTLGALVLSGLRSGAMKELWHGTQDDLPLPTTQLKPSRFSE